MEKADLFGGSTALSGGVIWVPANPLQTPLGIEDSVEDGPALPRANHRRQLND